MGERDTYYRTIYESGVRRRIEVTPGSILSQAAEVAYNHEQNLQQKRAENGRKAKDEKVQFGQTIVDYRVQEAGSNNVGFVKGSIDYSVFTERPTLNPNRVTATELGVSDGIQHLADVEREVRKGQEVLIDPRIQVITELKKPKYGNWPVEGGDK